MLLKRTLLIMLLLSINSIQLLAFNGDEFFDQQEANSIQPFVSYVKTNNQENINTATGGLTIVATDISLPGRNGLDLNISRAFRSRHRVATAANHWYSDLDCIPQWANMGMGWKCFIAVFERHPNGQPVPNLNFIEATLYMGDGGVIKFYRDPGSSIYYSQGAERWRVVMEGDYPVLYLPNGVKYYFKMYLTQATWGFWGYRYCATRIMDSNGNTIDIHYANEVNNTCPQAEISYITDTWKRNITFTWENDLTYANVGLNPKRRLKSIVVTPLDADETKTYTYNYTSLNVGRAQRYAVTVWTFNPLTVSSLTSVYCNGKKMVSYEYGGSNGAQDYHIDYSGDVLPNADRGQLVKVIYPWGAIDRYSYRLFHDDINMWNDADNYYSVVDAKGNASVSNLIDFSYYRDGNYGAIDVSALYPGRYFFNHCVAVNNTDSTQASYWYQPYKCSVSFDSMPLLVKEKEYNLGDNIDYASLRQIQKTYILKEFVSTPQMHKYAYLPSTEITKQNNTTVNSVSYSYPNPFSLFNYCDILSKTENGVGGKNRKINYSYLHQTDAATYCNATTWILDRINTAEVFDEQTGIRKSYKKNYYDIYGCILYSTLPGAHDNDNFHSTGGARGNLNKADRCLLNNDGTDGEWISEKFYYDECGNVIQKTNGNSNNVFYSYNLSSPGTVGQDKTTDPDYLRKITNSAYGVSAIYSNFCMGQKMYDWTPQSDTTHYMYEPIYSRPYKVIKKGDSESKPSLLYQYNDLYPAYTEITKKQNEFNNIYKEIYNYDVNGNLAKTVQGNVEVDYEYNNSGMLKTKTVPHYSTEPSPLKYKYFYDGLKRVKLAISPDNKSTFGYYGAGWKKIIDAEGDSTIYNYDMLGRLVSVRDALNNTTTYGYDIVDNLTSINTADNKEFRYHYDALGRLTGKHDRDMDSTYFHYDKNGNVDLLQDANLMAAGKYMVNRYDGIDRLNKTLVKSATDSTVLVQNVYDRYDFASASEYGSATPGESLFVSIPDNNTINYTYLSPQSSAISNNSILITYQPFIPLGQDTIISWTNPFDSYIDINGNVYNNDKLIVSSTPQTYNILYSFPIFRHRNRNVADSLLSPFETTLRSGAIIDSAVFSLHTVSFKDYASIKINVCNPLPFLGDGCTISPQSIPNAPSLNIYPYNGAGWHPFMFKDICQYFCDASINDYNNDFDDFYTFPSVKYAIDNPGIGYPHTEYYSGNNIVTTAHPKLEMYVHSADHNAPVLSQLMAEPTLTACNVSWNYGNDWTYDTLEWGNSLSYGNVIASNCTTMVHSANLTGLNPRTKYHFRIKSRDVTGNSMMSRDYIFIPDTLGFTSYSISEVKTSSAVVRWSLNWPAEVTVKYGLDPQCSFTALNDQSSASLTGLIPGQKYYVIIEAINGSETIKSPILSFRTIGRSMFADSTGHLTKIIDQTGETVYGYDDLGRNITKRIKYNDFSKYYYFYYNYDDAGNIISAAYPDGAVNTYNYDQYNNLGSLFIANDQINKYSYNAAGACSTEAYINGVNGIFTYNSRLWLKNAVITKGTAKYFSHGYNYDAVGNLINDKDNTGLSSSIDRSYSYDPLNRLTNESSDLGYDLSYQYDAMGNRTGGDYAYYYGTNRLQTGNGKTYGYDASGNLNNDGVWSYEYDYQNKLRKTSNVTTNGSTNIEYLYNASGLRVKEKKTDVSSGEIGIDAATFPETYDDLVVNAPSGDGHDDARDLGKLKVHVNDNFIFFTIEHKYLYGASQGDYENIYIAVDTDQEFGSGSTILPDDIKVSVSADNAWEYCAYVYSEKDFGIYIGEGFKLENLITADGKKMTVNITSGANSKAIIKIPLALVGHPKKIRFAVMSTMPSSAAGGGVVCDVLPGGRLALDGTLITQYNEFVMPRPGTTITTVETKYSLYDGLQVMCDLDGNGNITKRYVYAGGKHAAMDLPGNKDYMVNGGFEYGNYEYPLTPWYKWVPYAFPACNWVVVSDVKKTGSFSLKARTFGVGNQIDALTNTFENYAQNIGLPAVPFIASCYMKAQDLTGGAYVIIECWTAGYGSFISNVYSNLQLGTFDWKLVSIPVNNLPAGTGAVKITMQRLKGSGTVWIDDVRCEEGVSRKEDKSYYYHCDYLGSPRIMTDASGAVIWRQDYYAFGSDYGAVSTGNTHKFTGHLQDAATGQYYAKARYFTTSLGRFSQPEPLLKGVPATEFLANPQLLNPYVYCRNNPLIFLDPDGNHSIEYSHDANTIYWVNDDGEVENSYWSKDDFVSGQNDEGEAYATLPEGDYEANAQTPGVRYGKAYGTFYIDTGDPRGRDIHGGGSRSSKPYDPKQGFYPTQGCLRMQNKDGEQLSTKMIAHGNKIPLHVKNKVEIKNNKVVKPQTLKQKIWKIWKELLTVKTGENQ